MIQKIKQAIKKVFGKEKEVKLVTTFDSQGHVLATRMRWDAGLSHDQKVLADLPGVRIRKEHDSKTATLYFCGVKSVNVLEQISSGDGGEIPNTVTLKGLKTPKVRDATHDQSYILKNVILHSNGVTTVEATAETCWEPICGDIRLDRW